MKQTQHIIIDLVILLVIPGAIIVAYFFYVRDTSATVLDASIEQQLMLRGQKVQEALRIIREVKISDAIFADPVFQQLEDQTVPVVTEDAGKTNPFAGGNASVAPTRPR